MNKVHRAKDSDLLEEVDEEDTPFLGKSIRFHGMKGKNSPLISHLFQEYIKEGNRVVIKFKQCTVCKELRICFY